MVKSGYYKNNKGFMKTSVVIFRPQGGLSVRQDTKNSFFNATDLVKLYNEGKKSKKSIDAYLVNDTTKRYMEALINENLNTQNSGELENSIMTTKRGKHGGTWMHPYLFIDFAMWLSPEFKVKVVRWVYDNLISLRIESGDSFKEVNEALFEVKPNRPPFDYANEAKMINKLVFGRPDRDQRNSATEDQLSMLKALQKADRQMILDGLDYYDRYTKLIDLKKYL